MYIKRYGFLEAISIIFCSISLYNNLSIRTLCSSKALYKFKD